MARVFKLTFTSGPTLSERQQAVDHRASGWDYLRLGLALGVILFHTVVTTQGLQAQAALKRSWVGYPVALLMPMFFALSGYLVTGSLERASLPGFLALRARRILPALAGHTIVCALLLGPLFTTLATPAYLHSALFHAWFLNLLGIVQFRLPGVFEGNPLADVNAQLWTVPVELACYAVLAVLALLKVHRRRQLMAALLMSATAALQARALINSRGPHAEALLLLSFMAGVVVCLYRDRIPRNAGLALLALALALVLLRAPGLAYFAPLPVSYLTVYLGLANPGKWALLRGGDYSYGMYLYGFTLQQVLVASLPLGRLWWGNFLLAVPMSLLFAMLSWHGIEKRVLRQREAAQPAARPAPRAAHMGGRGSTKSR